ncbi:MAG TPA: DUF5010 domain-containing protein, partial [Syntrophobacteraceae bacterium]|nr:DUF5010 domain-containing protein [Syntrophobacteraceae bacterium]
MNNLRRILFASVSLLSVCIILSTVPVGVVADSHDIPPPFCSPWPISSNTTAVCPFHSNDRIIGTYYFYWYDKSSNTHIIDPSTKTDALTDHPATLDQFSWKSVEWHKKQLSDMEAAGIDMALMVFWGAPSEHDRGTRLHWSYEGLPPLVEARDQLLKEGKHPPFIGLIYDTSTLRLNSWKEQVDLTTQRGKEWFYSTVRDFFSCIPQRHWATIDGRPIFLLYNAGFASNYDQSVIDYTRANFAKDFGRDPYIVPQFSWIYHNVRGDSFCVWGGSSGLKHAGISELGPGFDDSAAIHRKRVVVPRDNGKLYEDSWRNFLRRPTPIVMVETWNEFHEGTDICESREYGRRYIDLTRKYVSLFKQGKTDTERSGKYEGAGKVDIVLGQQPSQNGVELIQADDGATAPVTVKGSEAVALANPRSHYIYFAVDESFKWADAMNLKLAVEYYDSSQGDFTV